MNRIQTSLRNGTLDPEQLVYGLSEPNTDVSKESTYAISAMAVQLHGIRGRTPRTEILD